MAVAAVLTACQTGERPSFDTVPSDSGAAPADQDDSGPSPELAALIGLLSSPPPPGETATYEIVQATQGVTATATLVRDGERTALDVRDTQFRESDGRQETCERGSGVCSAGYAEQLLSDLQITTGFWGPALRQTLTSPTLGARIGPITTFSRTIAGQQATCIEIPGPSRVDRYCALSTGIAAAIETAAVTVALTDYRATFDESTWDAIPAG